MNKRKILVTSALPYANGDIHLGHLVEYLQTDFWVRFQKMCGHECLYFCADDTHGTPIMISAKNSGQTPEELISQKKKEHLKDFENFEIEFTHYSSTHSAVNKEISYKVYEAMEKGKHITKKVINQKFCEECEMFLPDRFIKGKCPSCLSPEQYGDACEKCGFTYTPDEMIEPYCVTCGKNPVAKKSEHIFFELNQFKEFLKEWIKGHVEKEVENKLLEWFSDNLKAWDISRDQPYFGFLIPGYKDKYFYVWVDAPIAYISITEEWCQKNSSKKNYEDYWKDNHYEIYHFIGKDIIYFHSLFWPAMLKCAGFSTPTKIFSHGFLTLNGEKMSKSKKTFINAKHYLKYFSPLFLRYYLAAKLSPSLSDIDLNLEDFRNKINAELVGKITNLASRGCKLLKKKFSNQLGKVCPTGQVLLEKAQQKSEFISELYEKREFLKIILEVRELAEKANKYFDEKKPWVLVKTKKKEAQQVITTVLNIFRIISIFLTPILPSYSKKVAKLFKESNYLWKDLGNVLENQMINDYEYLAERIETSSIDELNK